MGELYEWAACYARIMAALVRIGRRSLTVQQVFEELEQLKIGYVDAKRALEPIGLGLIFLGKVAPSSAGYVLAVPNSGPLVAQLFDGTPVAASAYDDQGGIWKDALRQAPAGVVIFDKKLNKVRIGGVQRRCTLLVVARVRNHRIADASE